MDFFNSSVDMQTLVIALGAGLAIWGVINLLESYGSDDPATMSRVYREANTKHQNNAIGS